MIARWPCLSLPSTQRGMAAGAMTLGLGMVRPPATLRTSLKSAVFLQSDRREQVRQRRGVESDRKIGGNERIQVGIERGE